MEEKNCVINGLKQGCWEDYWSNDQPYYKGHYYYGQKQGLWKYYHEDGELEKQEFYCEATHE